MPTIPQSVPGGPPTAAERAHASELHALQRQLQAALAGAPGSVSPAERTAVVADVLAEESLAASWCPACQADQYAPCREHMQGLALADAARRVAWRRVTGTALLVEEL